MDSRHIEKCWDFEDPPVHDRNDRIFASLKTLHPSMKNIRALEIGCADGVFTRELALRCHSVVACDISRVACTLAAERCRDFSNVSTTQLDLQRDSIEGTYDWVFVMDVLYYVHGRRTLTNVVEKLARALAPDGALIVSDCRLPEPLRRGWWMHFYPEGADAVMAFIDGRSGLRLVHLEAHPDDGKPIPGYLDHVIGIFKPQI